MSMKNPPHPGEFIKAVYLVPLQVSLRKVAIKMNIAPSTLSRLLNKNINVSPEMALRLSKTLGRSPESWLAMQDSFDLYQAKQSLDLSQVEKLTIDLSAL